MTDLNLEDCIMKKIDGHAHILNTIAGFNGKGRLNALGNGYAI